MAIEKDLKRIADSIEKLVEVVSSAPVMGLQTTSGESVHTGPNNTAPTPPAQTAAPTPPAQTAAPTPPAQTTAPAAPVAMTPEELNAVLVAEFKRIGNRAPIDAAMQELGVTSVANLPADQQQALVAKVKAIPGAAA